MIFIIQIYFNKTRKKTNKQKTKQSRKIKLFNPKFGIKTNIFSDLPAGRHK